MIDATPDTFAALVLDPRGVLVVVDFWGPNCPNCEAFAAVAPDLVAELDETRVRFVKVDAYAFPELATRFGLHGIPTFLLVRDGKKIGKMTGYQGRDFWLSVIRDQIPAV